MTARIDLIAPATISLIGSFAASIDPVPLSVANVPGGMVSVTIIAGNHAARLSASATGGATVASGAASLFISGTVPQVNAALASMELTDTGPDTLTLTASAAGALSAVSDIAVTEISAAGLAFAAPPASFSISPYSITSLAGLVLGDPAATGLAAAGLGQIETMAITLSVALGVLLLPGYSAIGGIIASGVGTAEIILGFTADQLPAVNALLGSLEWAGPAAISGLAYAARDVSGPLGTTVTSGNIIFDIAGTQGPFVSLNTGLDSAILGITTLSLGSTLQITSDTTDIGGLYGQDQVFIAPGAALQSPYNLIALSGTNDDFGALGAASLLINGALLAPSGVDVSGPVTIGSLGEIDFDGSLIAGAADAADGMLDMSLAAGALITGNGNLVAGNFSESGAISGSGTILAAAGETLAIAAGQISGTTLQIAGGGVLALGPLDPLYGVFDPTPLSIAASTTLTFLSDSGAAPAAGGFADTLAQTGGVIVISSPQVFAGQIVNFAPGDRLIFPGLSFLNISSISPAGFVIYGPDAQGTIQTYTINAAIPAGTSPFVSTDAAGDYEISLRDIQPDVFFGGATISQTELTAAPSIAQPLAGLSILAGSWNGQSVAVTLSVSHGLLSGPGMTGGALVIISAASPTALNAELQTLSYTASAGTLNDLLTISSTSAAFSGLFNLLPIGLSTNTAATVGYFGDAAQAALFNGNAPAPVQAIAAPGALIVSGAQIFDTALDITGLGGTALDITSGASAIFDPGAQMNLQSDVTIASAALLGVLTNSFSVAGNVSVAGSLIVTGALSAMAGLLVAGGVYSSGALSAGTASLSAGGLIEAQGGAENFATLADAGTLELFGASSLNAASAVISGVLALGGSSSLVATGAVLQSGAITVGPDAAIIAPALFESGGTLILEGVGSFSTVLSDAGITLSGGSLLAANVSLQPGALLEGGGVIGAAGSLGALAIDGGAILASGFLCLADDITLANGGAIGIAGSSALDIAHEISGGTISFDAGAAELTINDLSQFSAAVSNMLDHDAIDLIGAAPSLVTDANGTISVSDSAGQMLGQFALGVASRQPALQYLSDGAGGTLITLGGDMPCFARGTRLLTPNGYRPVEDFSPGDPIITDDGERRAVCWIGWRTLDLKFHEQARPVLFAPDCLGPGIPERPVSLSPLHAVLIEGVLVPALHLVNGATITRGSPGAVTYYHVELERHQILRAEGMRAESYLDQGNRGQLHAERGRRGSASVPCAPVVTSGPRLAAIRRRLHEIALGQGFGLTYSPAVRGVTGDVAVLPRRLWSQGRRELRFRFAAPAAALGLTIPAAAPADTDPDSSDRRQLGLCLAAIPPGVTLAAGWHPKAGDDAGIWMGTGAQLAFGPAPRHDLTLSLAAIIRSWVPPAPMISRPAARGQTLT